jgi:hypothetical protein
VVAHLAGGHGGPPLHFKEKRLTKIKDSVDKEYRGHKEYIRSTKFQIKVKHTNKKILISRLPFLVIWNLMLGNFIKFSVFSVSQW